MSGPSGIPFGHFRLIKRLARGGMAEVFLARQRGPEGFDRLVALKRILPHLVDTTDFVRMFLDEARLAARLSHPNIVHIYEFGKVDDHYFIAMEYVDGVHAGHIIKHGPTERLPPALVARIGADACSGLNYAHNLRDTDGRALQVVHRDISPPNLMLSYDGVVKLVDFGIAKAVSQVEQTRPGVVKGKFAYMSPEQTTAKQLDGRSDVFSLGVLLWELLAGRIALERADPVEAMRSIRDGKIPPIQSVRPDVPDTLAAAVGKALAVHRDDRFTAAQLGVSLEEFVKASPDMATAMQLADWVRQRFPRTSLTGPQPALGKGTAGATAAATSTQAAAHTAAAPHTAAATPTGAEPFSSAVFAAPMAPGGLPLDTDVDGRADTMLADDYAQATALIVPARLEAEADAATSAFHRLGTPRRAGRIAAIAAVTLAAIVGLAFLVRGGDPKAESAEPEPVPVAISIADAAPPPPAPPDARPLPDAAPELASVEIVTRPPGAVAIIDDEFALTTPAQLDDLAPGVHSLRIELDGYQVLERQLRIVAGERRTLELPLEKVPEEQPRATRRPPKAPGKLTVRTTPYSVVFLGGKKLGVTPFAGVELPAGTHTLSFRNPDRKTHQRRVTIKPGRITKLNFALP